MWRVGRLNKNNDKVYCTDTSLALSTNIYSTLLTQFSHQPFSHKKTCRINPRIVVGLSEFFNPRIKTLSPVITTSHILASKFYFMKTPLVQFLIA